MKASTVLRRAAELVDRTSFHLTAVVALYRIGNWDSRYYPEYFCRFVLGGKTALSTRHHVMILLLAAELAEDDGQ